jgi:thiamine kinase-like enzyme
MGLTLEQAISRVPFLKDAKDIKTTQLSGGITNLNYRIDSGGQSYMLRITGERTDLLGIRRDIEHKSNLEAGKLGIAPEVLYFIEPEGYLVTRFIKGRHIPPEEITRPDNIRRVVKKLRLYHTRAPEVDGESSVFRRVEWLTKVSKEHNCKFPFDFDWIMQNMYQVEETLKKDPFVPAPCHCDLLNLNWMVEDVAGDLGELRLLDWEYAGMDDIFHDLGNFAHHHGLNDDQVKYMLYEYFGEVTEKHFARIKLMTPMSEIFEAMWGITQTGISELDEDFQGYADLWFTRTRIEMTDARWDQWLKEVVKK